MTPASTKRTFLNPVLIKRAAGLVTALAVFAVAVTFLPLDLLRPRIERALEQGLGRKVEINGVHFTLLPGALPGPGFTLDGVTIHEDPRVGIEPFAYMDSLGASVRWTSFFTRQLEFSLLNLGDATINLVKSSEGQWNFQSLLAGASTNSRAMPSIRMRGGRVNFKSGDTKSVFYFNDADLDVAPYSNGSLEVRFGGAPSRTDHTAQEFGRLFVRGNSSPGYGQLNFAVELEKSSLAEALRWFAPDGPGVHGNIGLEAQLSGSPSRLDVIGKVLLSDVHRWELLPSQSSRWQLPFRGIVNLAGERLDLAGPSGDTVSLGFHTEDWLRNPQWTASVDVRDAPLDTVLKIARHLGAGYPEQSTAEGLVSGTLSCGRNSDLAGQLELHDAVLSLPDTEPLRAASAIVNVADGALRLVRTMVRAGENQSADVEAMVALSGPRDVDFKITTRGLDVTQTRSFGMAGIPVLRDASAGVWRGSAHFKDAVWSADFDLRNAQVSVEGLAAPVRVDSAALVITGNRIALSRLRGHVGDLALSGAYRYEPDADRPHKFTLSIPEAELSALQELLAPVLPQPGGLLSRTLGLGNAGPPPPWLEARHAEGSITIDSFLAGEVKARNVSARLFWDGSKIRIADLVAKLDPGGLRGAADIDLTGRATGWRLEGQLLDLAWRGGSLDLEGVVQADAAQGVRLEGKLRGRGISFAPDAEFRTVSAAFQARGLGAQAKWTLTDVEVNQGGDVLTGSGATQADGKLVLDLGGRGRQLHLVSTLFAAPPQP